MAEESKDGAEKGMVDGYEAAALDKVIRPRHGSNLLLREIMIGGELKNDIRLGPFGR